MSKVWKIRGGVSSLAGAACVALTLAVMPAPSMAQGVAIEVSAADLAALSAQCVTEAACAVATRALTARIAAANPGVPIATIVGSVAVAISNAYNNGVVPAAVAVNMLAAARTEAVARNLPTVVAAIAVAQANVAEGSAIDLQAVALGEASPT